MMYSYFALIFAIAVVLQLGIVVARVRREFMSILLLYCICCLYFFAIPFFFDVLSLVFGYQDVWVLLISSDPINYLYDYDAELLARVGAFVLGFNSCAFFSYRLIRRKKPDYKQLFAGGALRLSRVYLALFVLLGWVGFSVFVMLYGFDWNRRGFGYISEMGNHEVPFGYIFKVLMRGMLAVSSVSVFFGIVNKRYLYVLLAAFPSIIITVLTSERPFIVPIIFSFVFGFYCLSSKDYKLSRIKLILLACFVYFLPSALLVVRHGLFGDVGVLELLPYPLQRDSSLNNLYYVFSDEGMYLDQGTGYSNVIRLLFTGIVPSSFFFDWGDALRDVTWYIAGFRFGEGWGTLHPTIFGWFFVDMRWSGIIMGLYIGAIMAVPSRIKFKKTYIDVALFSILSIFIVVSSRGSVQFAYATSIYSVYFLILLEVFIKILPKNRKVLNEV